MEPNYAQIAQHIIDGVLTDMAAMGAARLLEDEIERRGLQERYVDALCRIVPMPSIPYEFYWGDAWALIRATPEQRARAFLKVVRR